MAKYYSYVSPLPDKIQREEENMKPELFIIFHWILLKRVNTTDITKIKT